MNTNEAHARVICVANQKGGVGKSTTAEALADGLVLKNHKTIIIDLDPQGNVSMAVGAVRGRPTAYEVMLKKCDAQEATQQRTHDDTQEVKRADILPASPNLGKIDLELTSTGKEYRLKEQLKPILSQYEYIIIDTPPALGVLTVNALTAADVVLIPAQADAYSMQGIGQLMETIDAVREYTNPRLELMGVLFTRHNARTILSRDMFEAAQEITDKIGSFLYTTAIRETVVIKEAQASRQSVYSYAPTSNAAADYTAFVDEFLERSRVHA